LRAGAKSLVFIADEAEPDVRADLLPLKLAADGDLLAKIIAANASKTNNATRWPRLNVRRNFEMLAKAYVN
jgi:hypothetical protein